MLLKDFHMIFVDKMEKNYELEKRPFKRLLNFLPYSVYLTVTKNVRNIYQICRQLERKIMVVTEEQEPKDLNEDDIQMLILKDHSNLKTLKLFRNYFIV